MEGYIGQILVVAVIWLILFAFKMDAKERNSER